MGLNNLVELIWEKEVKDYKSPEKENLMEKWGGFDFEQLSKDKFDVISKDEEYKNSFGYFLVYGSSEIFSLQFPNRFGLRKAGKEEYICDGLNTKQNEQITYCNNIEEDIFKFWKGKLGKLKNIPKENSLLLELNEWMKKNKTEKLEFKKNKKENIKENIKCENINKDDAVKKIGEIINKRENSSCFQPGIEWKLVVLQSISKNQYVIPFKYKNIDKDYNMFVSAVEDMEGKKLSDNQCHMIQWGKEHHMIEWEKEDIDKSKDKGKFLKEKWKELTDIVKNSNLYHLKIHGNCLCYCGILD